MGKKQALETPVEYYLLAEDRDTLGESYGIRIICGEEKESVRDITMSQNKILALLDRVMTGVVTPITLRDVVEDWLLC
ncbi:MAG: DUF6514 family protein [Oscillibacter sp.]